MARTPAKTIKHFILDVDGVLTDGQFHYSADGKVMKIFGPDDNDAIALLQQHIEVVAITGDKRGLPITQKRVVDDMKLPLHVVSTFQRKEWIAKTFNPSEVAYMGDGIFDAMVFDSVGYAIAPANAFFAIKPYADFITNSPGGSGAAAEACWHILETFFTAPNPLNLNITKGEWGSQSQT